MNTVLDPPPRNIDRGKNDDPSKEDKVIEDQRRRAAEEKAQRAKERMELVRQLEIQNSRRAVGLCTLCGRRMVSIARFFGSLKHRTCKSFIE